MKYLVLGHIANGDAVYYSDWHVIVENIKDAGLYNWERAEKIKSMLNNHYSEKIFKWQIKEAA